MCEIELLETESVKTLCRRMIHCLKLFIRIAFCKSSDSDKLQSGFRATSPDLKWCFVNLYQGSPTLLLEIYRPTDVSSNPIKPTCTSWLRCAGLLDNYRQVCWSRVGDPWSIHYIYISQTHLSKVHSDDTFTVSMCSLGFEPTTLLTQCSTTEPQEHC